MRTFWISLVIFLILLGGMIGNYFYIHHVTDSLLEQVTSLPSADVPGSADAVRTLREYWNRHRNRISLSVNYMDLNQCSSLLASLEAFAEAGDTTHFGAVRMQLSDAITEVSRLEAFSIGNLL